MSSSKVKIISALTVAVTLGLSVHGAANAGATAYKYDALGRVVQVNYPDGAVIKYTYDAAGNRTQVVSTVSTAGTPSSSVKVVVLPLLGGVVIPVN